MSIEWPDIKFPPVNLYSLPHQRDWPPQYLTLESQYCSETMQKFYSAEEGDQKEILRQRLKEQREEFNRLWNMRAGEE